MYGKRKGLWLWATVSLGLSFGCGQLSSPTDAGSGCTADSSCGTGKVCHPILKACVDSCTGAADCPAAEKTCAHLDGTAATATSPGFCQCSTDQLCAASVAGQVCGKATKQCTAKCTTNANCPIGSTCEATSGQCVGGSNQDGGMTNDGGTSTDGGTGMSCDATAPQPDVCGYGHQCNTAMTCDEAADDRCGNITAAIAANHYTAWDGHNDTGPVIYFISDDTDLQAGCSDPSSVAYTATIYAYAGANYTFPSTIGNATQLTYFRTDGSAVPVNDNLVGTMAFPFASYTPSNNGKNVAIKLTVCGAAGSTSIATAFAFTGGNALCTTLNHQ